MKLKNLVSVLFVAVSAQLFGQSVDGMQRLPNGLQYKIFTSSPAPKIKLNDIVSFNFIQKTEKDSILANSFEVNRPATLQVQAAKNVADLMDFFPLLAVNDSALVFIPTDSIFVNPQMQRPPFLPAGSLLKIILKVTKVQSMEEAMSEQKRIMDEMKGNEASALAKYFSENKAPVVKTASGLRYRVTKPSTKAKPLKGDTVFVNYVGRTLDGKVFDSSIEAEAQKANLQQPGRTYEPISVVVGQGNVIKGWDEGLLLLNEGSNATFIIPSELAYGAQGAGEDIAPYSPLLFDVEVVKVKHAKKAVVPVKKATTPAKKQVAKKPVAKPVAKKPVAKTTTKKN